MEDKIFPILWKSGVTRMSVRLLHTMWIDGKSIMKLWIIGITTLEEEGQRVTFLGMEVSSQISVLNEFVLPEQLLLLLSQLLKKFIGPV